MKTKYCMPDFNNRVTKRKRLIDQLSRFEEYKVILLTAPAGYGKTALLTSWLTEKKEQQRIIWLTLDEEDNEEELFWSYFLQAFYRNEWIPEDMKKRAESMFNNTMPFNRLFLTYFINHVSELGTHIIMVLDDSEVIKEAGILENLEFLLRHLPANIHIVLSGRGCPDIGFAKLKSSGKMLAISGEEICFTQEETVAFYHHAAQITLTREEYNEINGICEGWITGMQIMALSVKEGNTVTLPVNKKDPLLTSYMIEEILQRVDHTIRDFLIETSVLGRFCPELCDYVFEMDNSREMLLNIESLNLFLICLDREAGWFRYHNLFQDFLVGIACGILKERTDLIYIKTSEWYEARKYWKEAISYSIKGNDFKKAVHLIEQFGTQYGCKGDAGLLHKWNLQMPVQVVKNNPRLLLNSAWAYAAKGKLPEMFQCMKEVEEFKSLPAAFHAEMTALSSSNPPGPNPDTDTMLLECRKALELLEPTEFLTQLICFNIGSLLLLKGCVEECLYYFRQCYEKSLETGEIYLTVISGKALVTADIRKGNLQKAEQDISELLRKTVGLSGYALPMVGLLYAQLAEIHYQRNQLEEAHKLALKGVRYGELGEDVWTAEENYLILEKVYQAAEDLKGYERIKKQALKCLEGGKIFDIGVKLECCHTYVLLTEGKFTLASRKISQLDKIIEPKLTIIYPEYVLVKSKYYAARGSYEKSIESLLCLKAAAETSGQRGVLCEVLVQLSTVYEQMGKRVHALRELDAALSLAEEQESIRFFINEGELMEGMLKRLIGIRKSDGKECAFAEELLYHFRKTPGENRTLQGDVLSGRELEVLLLAAQGANTEEIAGRLFVTKNTVKTHLLHIYTKLDVHSRIKAVSKAKKLNLI